MDNTENVYCPKCREKVGRDKLLFKRTPDTRGTITILCRGCREEVAIELGEPVSRVRK